MKERKRIGLVALASVITIWLCGTASAQSFKIIVHPSQEVSAISKRDAAAMFLKKTKVWDNGKTVMPIDLPEESRIRAAFSEDVLGRSVSAVKSYWQTRIFSGRDVPPPTKATDADVVAYVSRNAEAIGYVSADASTSDVKVLKLK